MGSADEAVETFVELEVLRARVASDRAPLESSAFPLLAFGVLTLASAAVVAAWGAAALGVYWLLATPVGLALTLGHYRRVGSRVGLHGISGRRLAWWGAALAAAAFFAGVLAGPIAPCYVVSAGYVVFARIGAERALGALGLVLATTTLGLDVLDADAAQVLPLVFGAALTGSGLVLRR